MCRVLWAYFLLLMVLSDSTDSSFKGSSDSYDSAGTMGDASTAQEPTDKNKKIQTVRNERSPTVNNKRLPGVNETIPTDSGKKNCKKVLITNSNHLWHIRSLSHSVAFQNDTDACWTVMIAAPGNYVIGIHALHFRPRMPKRGSECGGSHLEIRDGCSASSWLLGRYCEMSELMVTSGACAYLRFRTSGGIATAAVAEVGNNGFRLQLQVLSLARRGAHPTHSDKSCRSLSIDSAYALYYFRSPGYPRGYKPNVDTCFLLSLSSALSSGARYSLHMRVLNSRLQASRDCRADSVHIVDGASRDGKHVVTWCGELVPHNVTSCGNSLHIRFRTDGRGSDRGFDAVFRAVPQNLTRCHYKSKGYNRSSIVALLAVFIILTILYLCSAFFRKCVQNRDSDEYDADYFPDDTSDQFLF